MHKFFEEKRPHNGMTYEEYKNYFEAGISGGIHSDADQPAKEKFEYTKLNFQRSLRIEKSYDVSDELKNAVESVNEKQLWMVITEPWCGDSAQTLPYIGKIAAMNPNIDLRILPRDENPDIMDTYLTNGTRSIPKLVAFDGEGNELFVWGPRPKEAQRLINQWKGEGIVKPELYEKLHLWYGRNRGKELEEEFLEIFSHAEQPQ